MGGTPERQTGVLEGTSTDWLLTHAAAKTLEHRHMASELPLFPGDHVLDAGCGPGIWTLLIAERVQPGGIVTGLDTDAANLAWGRSLAAQRTDLEAQVRFQAGRFERLEFADETFDVVLIGNCLVYFRDPRPIIRELHRVLRPGGRLITRNPGGVATTVAPLDEGVLLELERAFQRSQAEDSDGPFLDTNIGVKLHGILRELEFTAVTTKAYPIQKTAPLTRAERRWLTNRATWLADRARPSMDAARLAEFEHAFLSTSDRYILDRHDFLFLMTEMITIGTKA